MGSWNPKQLNPCLQLPTRKGLSFKLMGLKFTRAVAPVLSSSPIMLSLLPPHINSSISQIPSPALVLTIYCIICCKCSKMYVGQTYKTLRDCFRHHRAAAKAKRSWPLPLYRSRLQQRCMDRPTWLPPPNRLLSWEIHWIRALNLFQVQVTVNWM